MKQLDRHRYLALGALVFALALSQTLNGRWIGDFWEHAAAVRELASAPFEPSHPLLALEKPHFDFTPYPLLLGLASRATSLSAVATLEVAGLVNLILLLIGLRLFVGVFTPRPNAPFYTLLFLLLLYGWSPWEASGLFNLASLGYVLSYPSTFAVTTAFFAVFLFSGWLRGARSTWTLVGVSLLCTAGVITHLLSAAFVYPTLIALMLQERAREPALLVPAGLALAASIGMALAWPYFGFVSLVADNVGVYDESNRFIYDGALVKAFPLILALPLVWMRLRRDWRDPLALLAVLYALLYAYGDASGHWNWGRTISFEFIVVFTLLGDFAGDLESRARAGEIARHWRVTLALVASMLLAVELVNLRSGLSHALPGAIVEHPAPYRFPAYAALFRGTDRDAVTLAGFETGRAIPAYGGKVVAYISPQAFVGDHPERQAAVRHFFSTAATLADRRAIIDRYDATYLMVDAEQADDGSLSRETIRQLGALVRSHDGLQLIRLNPTGDRTLEVHRDLGASRRHRRRRPSTSASPVSGRCCRPGRWREP